MISSNDGKAPILRRQDTPASLKRMCNLHNSRIMATTLILLGVSFLLAGVFTARYIDSTLDQTINDALKITSTSGAGYETWRTNTNPADLPTYKKFYIFNVTNPEAFTEGREKLKVQEVGPIVVRERFVHFNVSWSSDLTSMKYKTWTYYVFEPSLTNVNVSESITIVNLPMQIVLAGVKETSGPSAAGLMTIFDTISRGQTKQLFAKRTIEEALWGYIDPTFAAASRFTKIDPRYAGMSGGNQTSLEEADKGDFDTVYTGLSDLKLAMSYKLWQSEPSLALCLTPPCPPNAKTIPWLSPEANNIQGSSTGKQFPRHITPSSILSFFDIYLLRVVPLIWQQTVTVHQVKLHRFIVDPNCFLNSSLYPPNSVYYNDGYNGLVNLSAAASGLPLFMSQAHFLGADPILLEQVEGVTPPQTDLHQAFLDIEPFTGAVLGGTFRAQANLKIGRVDFGDPKHTVWFPNATETIAPLYWFEEGGGIDEATGAKFANVVYTAQDISKYSYYVGVAIGLAVILSGLIIMYRAYRYRQANNLPFFRFSSLPPLEPSSPRSSFSEPGSPRSNITTFPPGSPVPSASLSKPAHSIFDHEQNEQLLGQKSTSYGTH
eukprot:TRINITY_DN5722_c0_g1_i7.p1 TRINITY_DN5722_c0_g1~~TRINITY_DN5722_c0_g1_i7.p1  ORF type:complete len:604 (+),score=100.57 TRINITY_DN5722_c0_g1_i7:169-1980(+)